MIVLVNGLVILLDSIETVWIALVWIALVWIAALGIDTQRQRKGVGLRIKIVEM